MFCIKCGTQLPEDANFCSKCGHPVQRQQASFGDFDSFGEFDPFHFKSIRIIKGKVIDRMAFFVQKYCDWKQFRKINSVK